MAVIQHEPHEVDDAGRLLAHLVDAHGYARPTIEGGTRSFLVSLHERGHRRMREDHPHRPR